jgi:hypothetical protein
MEIISKLSRRGRLLILGNLGILFDLFFLFFLPTHITENKRHLGTLATLCSDILGVPKLKVLAGREICRCILSDLLELGRGPPGTNDVRREHAELERNRADMFTVPARGVI